MSSTPSTEALPVANDKGGFNDDTRASSSLPQLIYGTAWKSENTTKLVLEALHAGFRAFDTAAQPKHYREDLLGSAIRTVVSEGRVPRSDIHIQTKFTTVAGHDPKKIPYDPTASLRDQVISSVTSSLHNLRLTELENASTSDAYIDCLLLHACLPTIESTLEVWEAMSSFVPHRVRCLGIANLNLRMLKALYGHMRLKPRVVQNAFFEERGFDHDLRAFCRQEDISYQGFWILKKNHALLQSPPVTECAQFAGISVEAALYGLLQALGITVLNGSTNTERMRADVVDLEKLHTLLKSMDCGSEGERWMEQLSAIINGGME